MVKQNCLRWKPVKCKSTQGDFVYVDLPGAIAVHFRGTLLSRILLMTKKSPLSFEAAINLIAEKQIAALKSGQVSAEPENYHWYIHNFVTFIADLGYHIDITGDEFEASNLTDKLC